MVNNLIQPDRSQQKIKIKESQIDFGLKVKKTSFFGRIEGRLANLERRLEVMPFWKNSAFVFASITSIIFPAAIIAIMLYKFDQIPSKMQLFFDTQKQSWTLTDKGIIIFVPIVYAIINLILINIIYSVFQYDRRLAQIIGVVICVNNLLFLIAFTEILSLALL